jgi:myo-inositol 2-dehydrogenase / D-chiro-inositol 1-dehydrogenase
MLKFALLGAGRIGRMHAANLVSHNKAELLWVFDINQYAADEVASSFGTKSSSSAREALSDPRVDAVVIATSTDTHASLVVESAKAGKAVFCEKPIDLSIDKVNWCRDQLKNFNVPIQIGFNRRFDPSHRKVALATHNREIGALEQVIISSRDPDPPSREYYLVAGGMLRDMTIHDFDLARFVLNEEVERVTALSATLFDPEAKNIGEIDSAMILMQTKSGKLCHINNSRHSSYGYDQRLEVHGSKGMMRSENHEQTTVEHFNEFGSSQRDTLPFFFIERYQQAFLDQLDAFIESVESKTSTQVTFEDGRKALILANASYESLETGKTVQVKYDC